MKKSVISFVILLFVIAAGLPAFVPRPHAQAPSRSDAIQKREAIYRLNNLGVALMEQYKHEEAAKKFREALAADPKFPLARINLAMAHLFQNDYASALSEAREALKAAPDSLHAHYVLANALRNEKLYDEAIAAFNQVLAADPRDPASNIQIGQIYAQKQQYEPAIAAFRRALDAEPYNATAAYSLAQALNRSGNQVEGGKMLQRFQQLRASGYATSLGLTYGEKGRYAEAVVSTGAESDLVSTEAPNVNFVNADLGVNVKTSVKPLSAALGVKLNKAEFNEEKKNELIAPFSSNVTLGDYDGDNRLDLFVAGMDPAGKPFVRLLHNDGGKFSDATEKSKIIASNPVSGAVFGDFDNDGKTDLVVFGYQTLSIWKNNGDGSFADVSKQAGLPAGYTAWAMTAAWVDADHDGDLDLFVGNFADLSKWPTAGDSAAFPDDFGGEENKLFRNNGNGTFADGTAQAGLGALGGGRNKTTAVVCTDYNNQRDIDFLVVNYGAPVQLFSNQRDGSFNEVAAKAGLAPSSGIKDPVRTLGVGAGDLNKDGYTDFYLADAAGDPAWYLSDGRGGFSRKQDPGIAGIVPENLAVLFADYDNDGLLDVIESNKDWLRVRRNIGGKVEFGHGPGDMTGAETRAFAAGDFNNDGAVDLVLINGKGELVVLKNEGAGKNFAALNLAGKTSNRSAIGAKAELRSGSLRQKLEVHASSPAPAAAGLTFGLGYRTQVDALQLLWPAGILQSEVAIKASESNAIEELDRKGTSCPILYAWNGERYEFVTDFLGGSAIGARVPGNQWNYPDTDEYVRVAGEQLKTRDGRYSILMNNQLEEVIYFDAVKLLAVDHPAETEIYPNERLMPAPPFPEHKIYSTRGARPPIKAVDDKDADILPLVARVDRRYPDDFELLRFKGYAKEHAITLDLGDITKAKQVLLLLTAWIDYADSTSNMAATQAGVTLTPPYVQVKNDRDQWQTVIPQMGFPAGLPKTMMVDLSGKFLCQDSRVRIVTSMRIYWDRILVDASDGASPMRVTKLDPLAADLRWRGFPREYSPDGRKPLIYDYSVIEPTAPWKAHLGNYTRFGDVRELLVAPDDRYAITRSGDEVQVDFDARRLPPLPAGWKRTFLVYADGFGKDMDWNSARPDTIGELPFHGMKSYPHAPGEHYPMTPRHLDYLRRYNTRTINEQLHASWQGVK